MIPARQQILALSIIMTSEIFVQAKGYDWGFTFLLDRTVRYNYIHPACLEFFWVKDMPETKDECHERILSAKNKFDADPFSDISSDDSILMLLDGPVARKTGRKNIKCYDGRLRRCAEVELSFDYKGRTYTETFYVDNKLTVAGVLGSEFSRNERFLIKSI